MAVRDHATRALEILHREVDEAVRVLRPNEGTPAREAPVRSN